MSLGAWTHTSAERSIYEIGDMPATPWRNGQGLTRAVASESGDGAPAWRISIATVTNGAQFSDFVGYERTFIPLGPNRITLQSGAAELAADADGAVVFDGARSVQARVDAGPAFAVNVMTRAGYHVRMRRRIVTGEVSTTTSDIRVVVVAHGTVTDANGRTVAGPAVLTPGHLVIADRALLLEIDIDPPALSTDRTRE